MEKRYPIRYSTWHISEKRKGGSKNLSGVKDLFDNPVEIRQMKKARKKLKVFVVEEVLVCGRKEDIPRIVNNDHYIARAFLKLFGKDKYKKRIDEGKYEVVKIELSDKTFGMGVGCFDD